MTVRETKFTSCETSLPITRPCIKLGLMAHGPRSLRGPVIVMEPETQAHVTGCLLGGAVGDALGAPVRFDGVAHVRIDSCKTQLKNHPELERRICLVISVEPSP